jgi:hypothetical protein
MNFSTDNETINEEESVELEEEMEEEEEEMNMNKEKMKNFHRNVFQICCGAHTVQLSIWAGLKTEINFLSKVRSLVKKLRTPKYNMHLKTMGLPKPKLDVVTRWGSTYLMCQSLVVIKDFVMELSPTDKDIKITTPNFWSRLESIIQCLAPLYELTKKLQLAKLALTDFYTIWFECKTKLGQFPGILAQNILKNMKERETKLFDNDVFYASMLLDPRYSSLILVDDLKYQKALKVLFELRKRLNDLQNFETVENTIQEPSTSLSDLQREVLQARAVLNDRNRGNFTDENIKREVSMFDEFIQSSELQILSFWASKKFIYPCLYKLAMIVFSVPSTQVDVERFFSCLKLILSDQRSSLGSQILNDTLLVKLNFDIVERM